MAESAASAPREPVLTHSTPQISCGSSRVRVTFLQVVRCCQIQTICFRPVFGSSAHCRPDETLSGPGHPTNQGSSVPLRLFRCTAWLVPPVTARLQVALAYCLHLCAQAAGALPTRPGTAIGVLSPSHPCMISSRGQSDSVHWPGPLLDLTFMAAHHWRSHLIEKDQEAYRHKHISRMHSASWHRTATWALAQTRRHKEPWPRPWP